jgi:hypothetical protein
VRTKRSKPCSCASPARLGDDRRGQSLPDDLVACPPEGLLGLPVPLDDRPVDVDAHECVACGLDHGAEALFARAERLLDQAALRDVGEHAAPHEGAVLGGDDRRGVPEPAALSVPGEQAVLGLVDLTGRVGVDVLLLRENALAVVRMQLPRPEVGVVDPFARREPEDLLDLRAHVGPPASGPSSEM